MKKMMIMLTALFWMAVSASAMSYEQARQQALFLTDKMAYELNLTEEQYEAAYEVNLDYLMSVNTQDDLYGSYWTYRNLDMSYILFDWQYRLFCEATYFYRPLYWSAGYWHFGIYARYPHRDYFYFGRPVFYASYRGGHAWHVVGGRGYYYGRRDHFRPVGRTHFGMHDRYPYRDYFYFGHPHFYTVYRGGHSWHNNGGHSWYHGRDFHGTNHHSGGHWGMRDGHQRGDYRNGFDHHKGGSHGNNNSGNNRGNHGNNNSNHGNNNSNYGGSNSNHGNSGSNHGGSLNNNNGTRFGGTRSSTRTTTAPTTGSSTGGTRTTATPNHTFKPNGQSVSRQSGTGLSTRSTTTTTRSTTVTPRSSSIGTSTRSANPSSTRSSSGFGSSRSSSSVGTSHSTPSRSNFSSSRSSSFGSSRSSSSFGSSRSSSSFGGSRSSSRGSSGSFGGSHKK